jgi:pimeloyl-ACP methyl ester carboxylesterase
MDSGSILARIEIGSLPSGMGYARAGSTPNALIVINGGQGFVRRADARSFARDARRVAGILPSNQSFVLLGYDPDPPDKLTADQLAASFAHAVHHFSEEPVHLAGISYGGLIAVRLAARHPERVRSLALIASAHRFSPEGVRRVRLQIACAEREDWRSFLGGFAAVFRRPWFNLLLHLRLWLGGNGLARKMGRTSTVVRYLKAMLDAPPFDLGMVKAPTLVVGGSDDQFFGGVMGETAAGIAGAQLRLLPGETHMAPVERRRDIAAFVGGFLDQQSRSGA